jgi:hypothetical protein
VSYLYSSNMTSLIGYINNSVIKKNSRYIYVSDMRIAWHIVSIIIGWFHACIYTVQWYIPLKIFVLFLYTSWSIFLKSTIDFCKMSTSDVIVKGNVWTLNIDLFYDFFSILLDLTAITKMSVAYLQLNVFFYISNRTEHMKASDFCNELHILYCLPLQT